MGHQVSSGTWTRRYAYDRAVADRPGRDSNRLSATSLPGDPAAGPYHATYVYDAHGNMTQMPHLSRASPGTSRTAIAATARHVVSGTVPVTYYRYDSAAQRVSKMTDNVPAAGQPATRQKERVYLGAVEIYREYGTDPTTSRWCARRCTSTRLARSCALVETRTVGTDPAPQNSPATSTPTTSAPPSSNSTTRRRSSATRSTSPTAAPPTRPSAPQTETPKRYRYTGKERDEENGLYYHGARYYAPWLGRWTSCDPAGLNWRAQPVRIWAQQSSDLPR